MEGPKAPDAYAEEDGLVGHQREERLLVLRWLDAPVQGNARTGKLESPILGHGAFSGPRASPPFDVQQGHPLLHIHLEPWVPPCVLFG